jgi:hypothetical protein
MRNLIVKPYLPSNASFNSRTEAMDSGILNNNSFQKKYRFINDFIGSTLLNFLLDDTFIILCTTFASLKIQLEKDRMELSVLDDSSKKSLSASEKEINLTWIGVDGKWDRIWNRFDLLEVRRGKILNRIFFSNENMIYFYFSDIKILLFQRIIIQNIESQNLGLLYWSETT